MPPTPPSPTRRPRRPVAPRASRALPPALVVLLALAGCGVPPELRQPPASAVAATATPTGTATPSATPTATGTPVTPTRSPTIAPSAVPCGSGLSGARVIALLRGVRVLPRDVRVTVRKGPLCAEGWQYTVLAVTGHEELQVVTRGKPAALELVTAGTDVCSAEVRVAGPPGIRALACDGIPGA